MALTVNRTYSAKLVIINKIETDKDFFLKIDESKIYVNEEHGVQEYEVTGTCIHKYTSPYINTN